MIKREYKLYLPWVWLECIVSRESMEESGEAAGPFLIRHSKIYSGPLIKSENWLWNERDWCWWYVFDDEDHCWLLAEEEDWSLDDEEDADKVSGNIAVCW